MSNNPKKKKKAFDMPSSEEVMSKLSEVTSPDDFFGAEGIFAQLFAKTMEQMLEAELSEELGYEKYEAKGRNSGNSRNGHYTKKIKTSAGEAELQVPRDRKGEYEPAILKKYASNTNELEEKIIGMYARGMSYRDIENLLKETYGVGVSSSQITTITDKIWPLVEQWQSRPLESIYPIVYLDALHIKVRQNNKITNTAIYIVLGVNLEGHRDVLGHWIGSGGEGANFWLSVVTDLKNRGVEDILIASVDGLKGFSDAIHSVFPDTEIQKCIIHQIRSSLKYVSWNDRKEFTADLKKVYQAATRELAESELLQLGEKWSDQYAIAVRSWENNWDELSTFFDYSPQIRRLIYTTNTVEGYNRQLRKVIKTKGSFSTEKGARKLLYLATQNIVKKWSMPIPHWPHILNQLVIRFEDRLSV